MKRDKKKVMILGAAIGQLPIILKAKELGYKVAVVDYDDKAVGIPHADAFYHASTIDVDGVVEAAKLYKPDGITTVQTDMPMRAIAAAAQALSLPGISIDTALRATDKVEMMRAFVSHGISSPWHYTVTAEERIEDYADRLTFPCVFKPTDNSGSRGVSLVKNKDQIEPAFLHSKRYSQSGIIMIEEFMEGPEVSVEVLMMNGTENVLAVTDKLTTGAPHFVEMGHSQQSQLAEDDVKRIKQLAGDALRAVGVVNGPGHVEIILTKGGPKMVELGARLGGDFITTDLVPLSTGVDMLAAAIQIACGEKMEVAPIYDKGSAIRFIPASQGTIREINGIAQAKAIEGIVKIEMLRNAGDTVPLLQSSLDRIGYVIAQAENAQAAIEICEKALDRIEVIVE